MDIFKIFLLFSLTAFFEILGCYLPWLVLKNHKSPWLFVPSIISLCIFAWLLTFHPGASGRTYAAYGGVYICVALMWLYFVDNISLTKYDMIGAATALVGMLIIMLQPKLPI